MSTQIKLETQVQGVLPEANGGTGNQAGRAADFFLPGMLMDFSSTTPPNGWLACPIAAGGAQLVSRTTYAALNAVYAADGYPWGAGDGSTTFGIPWFPPDYAAVQANSNVGTETVGAVIAHTHAIEAGINGNVNAGPYLYGTANTSPAPNVTTNSTGGSANLPAGVRVLKCVKY